MPDTCETDYEIGQDNLTKYGLDLHRPVFWISSAPVPQRIFWATMEGVIAAALLLGGGADALGALQAAASRSGCRSAWC